MTFLPWLRRSPESFRERCAQTDALASERGASLQRLAGYALDSNALNRLARSITGAIEKGLEQPLSGFTLGLVSNATTDLIVPGLVGSAARYGLALKVVAAPFGMTTQAALGGDDSIVAAQPNAILLALDYRSFFADYALEDDPQFRLDAALEQLKQIVAGFGGACAATVVVQTLAAPPERLFGSLDRLQKGTLAWLVQRFNERLHREIAGPGIAILDVEAIGASIGLERWYDTAQWNVARLPFAQQCVPLYCDHVGRLLAALRGKSRKVLVLDLDNTLWGGVIGDDGVQGVRLAQGDAVGEAFLELQRAALALKRRGILLAVCSKNDEEVALKAIREHPDMVLREQDFSAFQINWSDKATNLEILAKRLSLGLDSFVFVDDNPAERAQVREALPSVFVLELPSDPSTYARLLMTSGLFESLAFSQEDRDRAEQYAANARRESLLAQSRDLDGFLRSLEMSMTFDAAGKAGWARFTQLINKSNQFNLTTRRYTEPEIVALAAQPDTLLLQVRLKDQFGDNGMICAIICRPSGNDWQIDTWVMSCRVLGRQVERAVLNEIVRRAAALGKRRIVGVFRATQRNAMVRDHYAKLGFRQQDSSLEETRWTLQIDDYAPHQVPIAIAEALAA